MCANITQQLSATSIHILHEHFCLCVLTFHNSCQQLPFTCSMNIFVSLISNFQTYTLWKTFVSLIRHFHTFTPWKLLLSLVSHFHTCTPWKLLDHWSVISHFYTYILWKLLYHWSITSIHIYIYSMKNFVSLISHFHEPFVSLIRYTMKTSVSLISHFHTYIMPWNVCITDQSLPCIYCMKMFISLHDQ